MKQLRSILLSAMMLLIIGQLFAGGFALSGVGSKATALGGAFRALADDGSAMYWNPAGLAFQDENSVSLGGTFILPSASWEPTAAYAAANPGYQAKEYEAEKSLRAFPNLLVTMAKNERIKYGLGVFVPYGLGTTWSAYENPSSALIYQGGFPENDMLSSIQVIDVHPTIAYKLLDNLSLGAGLSLYYGNIHIAQLEIMPTSVFTPVTFDMAGKGIGFGANLGVMYQPLEKLSLGLSGKIPSDIPLKGDAEGKRSFPGANSAVDAIFVRADWCGSVVITVVPLEIAKFADGHFTHGFCCHYFIAGGRFFSGHVDW